MYTLRSQGYRHFLSPAVSVRQIITRATGPHRLFVAGRAIREGPAAQDADYEVMKLTKIKNILAES
jgi:hypothetical protein